MTTEFNQRERYILASALGDRIFMLERSGDFPEKSMLKELHKKVNSWVWEVEGDITSNNGAGD